MKFKGKGEKLSIVFPNQRFFLLLPLKRTENRGNQENLQLYSHERDFLYLPYEIIKEKELKFVADELRIQHI